MNWIGFGMIIAGLGMSWGVMIHGWGLDPKSWAWIIGGTAASFILIGIGNAIANIK